MPQGSAKLRTFKDLITMEIPLFMPDLELQALPSGFPETFWNAGRVRLEFATRSPSRKPYRWYSESLRCFSLPKGPIQLTRFLRLYAVYSFQT